MACRAFAILCVLLIVLEIFFLAFYLFCSELNEMRAKILVLITLIIAGKFLNKLIYNNLSYKFSLKYLNSTEWNILLCYLCWKGNNIGYRVLFVVRLLFCSS